MGLLLILPISAVYPFPYVPFQVCIKDEILLACSSCLRIFLAQYTLQVSLYNLIGSYETETYPYTFIRKHACIKEKATLVRGKKVKL